MNTSGATAQTFAAVLLTSSCRRVLETWTRPLASRSRLAGVVSPTTSNTPFGGILWQIWLNSSCPTKSASLTREVEPSKLAQWPEVDVDVVDRWQHLVAVVAIVILGAGPRLQAHVEAREDGEQVPLELQQGVAFAGTQGAERQ